MDKTSERYAPDRQTSELVHSSCRPLFPAPSLPRWISTAPLQARHIPTGLRRAACAVGLVSLMCSFCRWFVKSGDASSCLLAARSDRPRLSQARPAHRGYITTAAQCGLLGRHASLSLSSRLLTPRSELAMIEKMMSTTLVATSSLSHDVLGLMPGVDARAMSVFTRSHSWTIYARPR